MKNMFDETFRAERGFDPLWVICSSKYEVLTFKEFVSSNRPEAILAFALWNDDYPLNGYAYIQEEWFASEYGIDHISIRNVDEIMSERDYLFFSEWFQSVFQAPNEDEISNLTDLL